jgi:hypothetical protein
LGPRDQFRGLLQLQKIGPDASRKYNVTHGKLLASVGPNRLPR